MRDWHLTARDPISLLMTLDSRLSTLDKQKNDVWELSIGDISSPCLGLQTTYGLKAISMRIFLGFSNTSDLVLDPALFSKQPVLTNFSSSYANLICEPFADLTASTEFWIVGSHLVCGRITLTNQSNEYHNINVLLSATLIPTSSGKTCSLKNHGLNTCLQGETGGIFPTLVMGGGPTGVISPYPALSLPLRLKPDESRSISWSCTSENDSKSSLENALISLKRDWEKELARLELIHDATTVDIHSGDQGWDAVFAFSQQHAFSSLCFDDENLVNGFAPYLTPDNTYAHPYTWNSTIPSGLLLNHLLGALLPGDPEIAKKLASNLCLQTPARNSSFSKINPSLSFPILANLLWKLVDITKDQGLMETSYPLLKDLVLSWFDRIHDNDEDGFPEFQSINQLGFYFPQIYDQSVVPAFDPGIKFVESPGLAFLLIREFLALEKMAFSMGDDQNPIIFREHIHHLSQQLKLMFHSKQHCFNYRDRDTHSTHPTNSILHLDRLKNQHMDVTLDPPQRIVVNLNYLQTNISKKIITMFGVDQTGNEVSESLTFRQCYSPSASLHLVSEQVFSTLLSIKTSEDDPSISMDLTTMDLTIPDISCLMPISGELISASQFHSALKSYIQAGKSRYQFGLPEILNLPKSMPTDFPDLINLPWNFLLLEILLDNSHIKVATDLFSRLMSLITYSLRHNHAFFEYFGAKDGYPMGHKHSLSGIAPIMLYLRMIGVRIISPTAVEISGESPFPGEITVKYRGMQINRNGKVTRVILPNGQVTRIYGSETHLIAQK
jgi:hypothetical protein